MMDAVEQHLFVVFRESEPGHVKTTDWVLRQKLMVLRFVFSKGLLLPAGEATIRVKKCRPFLPEYWWEVLMGDQGDATMALLVPAEVAKHRVTCARGLAHRVALLRSRRSR